MKTAIIYARVSSAGQADEELPVQSQIERAHAKAEALGATVLRVFADEGVSGTTSRRPEFQKAVAFCEAHKVKLWIVWDTARFARNHVDAGVYRRRLRDRGTNVVYVSSDIDGDTDDGWFLEGIYGLIDEKYSRNVARDTKRSMIKNARDGFWNGGRVPFGYRVMSAGKRQRLEVVETEAIVVRRMFSLFVGGLGCKAVARQLNADGLLKRGHEWTKTTVGLAIKCQRYAGRSVYNERSRIGDGRKRNAAEDLTVADGQPSIVSIDVFNRAQEIMAGRTSEPNHVGSPISTHLFTGLLRCHSCGQGLQIETARGRSRMYSYYNCSGFLKKGACQSRRMPSRDVDQQLLEMICDAIVTPERLEEISAEIESMAATWATDRDERRKVLVSEMRELERKRTNLFEVLEMHGKAAPNVEDMGARIRDLSRRIADFEAKIVGLDDAPDMVFEPIEPDVIAGFVREILLHDASPEAIRAFLQDFIDHVVIGEDWAEFVYRADRLVNPGGNDRVHSRENWLPDQSLLRTVRVSCAVPLCRRGATLAA